MPLPQQTCEIPDDVCCRAIYDIAKYILDTVYAGIIDCMPDGCDDEPMPLLRYVTMGDGDDGIADSLTVAFQGCQPSAGSADARGRTLPVGLEQGAFDVRLREKGWPIIQTEGGILDAPDPEMQQKMALHAYSHGEKMYRVLRSMVQGKTLTPPGIEKPNFSTLRGLRTLNPRGGVVGFVATIVVDLPWNIGGTT